MHKRPFSSGVSGRRQSNRKAFNDDPKVESQGYQQYKTATVRGRKGSTIVEEDESNSSQLDISQASILPGAASAAQLDPY